MQVYCTVGCKQINELKKKEAHADILFQTKTCMHSLPFQSLQMTKYWTTGSLQCNYQVSWWTIPAANLFCLLQKTFFFRIFENFHRATILASMLQTFPLVHVRFCLIVGWFFPATNMVAYYFWLPNTTFLDYTALLIFLLLFFCKLLNFPLAAFLFSCHNPIRNS